MSEDGRISSLERKVEKLESELTEIKISIARMETKVGNISDTTKTMLGDQKWLFRVVVAGFAGAAITFVVRGGLVSFGS